MNKFTFQSGFPRKQAVRGEERGLTASWFLGNLVITERFTRPQRVFCVKKFYLNDSWSISVRHLFCVEYDLHGINQCPRAVLIKKWVKKFEETESALNVKKTVA